MNQMKRSSLRYRFHKHIIQDSCWFPTYKRHEVANNPDAYFNKFHKTWFVMPESIRDEALSYVGLFFGSLLELVAGLVVGWLGLAIVSACFFWTMNPALSWEIVTNGDGSVIAALDVFGSFFVFVGLMILAANLARRILIGFFRVVRPSGPGFVKAWINDQLNKTCTPIKYKD